MPKQKRWAIKQALGYAVKDVVNAQTLLVREGAAFESVHPELYAGFAACVSLLEQVKSVVEKLDERI